jgi:hypothetical protein
MGCNSHLTIEIQGRYGDQTVWETWALDIPESRDYKLYEAMAGARGEEENAIVTPRGIPADASDTVIYWIKRYGEDGHTHSWLYPKEFEKALKQSKTKEFPNAAREWEALAKVLNSLSDVYGEDHVRVVFFFDN